MKELDERLINKFLNNECSEEELIEIKNWIELSDENSHELFKMEELYHLGKLNEDKISAKKIKAERKLDQYINELEQKKHRSYRIFQAMKYAAAIIVAFFIGGMGLHYYHNNIGNKMIMACNNDANSIKKITLPDGSQVWLNQESTLQYPEKFNGETRELTLNGEAYFEVTKNRHQPFVVKTSNVNVKVLGTKFNLKSKKGSNEATATLLEGEIKVTGNNNEGMIILSPGQKAEINKLTGKMIVKNTDAKLDAVWHNNLIPFHKATIFDISKTLERFYDAKIILSPDIKINKTYSGVLKKKPEIEEVLKSLQNSIPIYYKRCGENIFIYSKY